MSTVTLNTLADMKANGEKIAVLTAYDASFARIADEAGVDCILVGDSLGNVIQGHDSTLPVQVEDMSYHCACVARAAKRALVIVDMPFMSYHNIDLALDTAAQLMQHGGAQMVKLEGGRIMVPIVEQLVAQGIPVCAHLGLTPQSVHRLGGYRVQARDDETAERLLEDALALESAGAQLMVLEAIPTAVATMVSKQLRIPTIGIGASVDCDGQVLVMHDALGMTPHAPKFVKDFLVGQGSIHQAFANYVKQVKSGAFPSSEHTYQ